MILTHLVVTIEKVFAEAPWGVLFRALDQDGRTTTVQIKPTQTVGQVRKAETWAISGLWRRNKVGPYLEARTAIRKRPSGKLLVAWLSNHVPGVGPTRAQRLWDAYGLGLGERLDEGNGPEIARVLDPDRPLLGLRIAASVIRQWREAESGPKLMLWLQERGIEDVALARQISEVFGDEAIQRLSENPYILASFAPWARVDKLGLELLVEAGCAAPKSDPRRLVGAVDRVIRDALIKGHTAVLRSTMDAGVAAKLGITADAQLTQEAIDLGRRNASFIEDAHLLRAPGCASMEAQLASRLRTMLGTVDMRQPEPFPSPVNAVLDRALHPEQAEAVARTLSLPVSCLRGGAGVGKTFTTQAITRAWEASGGNILLCALSGKAALRLSQATGRLAKTLARTLSELERLSATVNEFATTTCGDADQLASIDGLTLVVVDEASMVDLPTLYKLASHFVPGTRLLLIGDEGQLPPIGFGAVYHHLVSDASITTSLNTIHRQAETSGIPRVARDIREGRDCTFTYRQASEGVSLIRVARNSDYADAVASAALEILNESSEQETVAVCATREGPAGAVTINQALQKLRRGSQPATKGFFGYEFHVGCPVVHTRNNYRKELGTRNGTYGALFNGSLGMVTAVDPGARSIVTDFDGEEYHFCADELLDVELAFALTGHKVQGSQIARVVIPISDSSLLDPSWIYTAITRAEVSAILVGDEHLLSDILRRPWAWTTRQTGFPLDWQKTH
jgi:exodeoxyribonuclease V alpha subunit